MKAFFDARKIAVIGSFREAWMGGYGVLKNLLDFGFTGLIYPINPSYSQVLGMTVYANINDVNDTIDLSIVITPPQAIPVIIQECARKGIQAAIIVSDGFAETGNEGAKLQQEVVNIARSAGIRLIGPNTIGIANTVTGLVTTPYFTGYNRISNSLSSCFNRHIFKYLDPITISKFRTKSTILFLHDKMDEVIFSHN